MHRDSSRFAACLLMLSVLAVAAALPSVAAGDNAPVDINRADAQQLATLPGVGESIAKRIIEFREEHGPFRRVEDLMKVKGIGEKSLEKIRPHASVGKSK